VYFVSQNAHGTHRLEVAARYAATAPLKEYGTAVFDKMLTVE
jgi:hypothetical protein